MGDRSETPEAGGTWMKEFGQLDPIDRWILRALSLHEHLSTLQLWYELPEELSSTEPVTREELLWHLERLTDRGMVEPLTQAEGGVRWMLKRGSVLDAGFLVE
jgi:hypothetical protein